MLEKLYSLEFLKKNPFYTFILGLAYGVIGIGIAVILFPEDPALVAVALTAILFLPTARHMMAEEETAEADRSASNFFSFWKTSSHIFKIYTLYFLGVFAAFAFFSLILDKLATNFLFERQLSILYQSSGGGSGGGSTAGRAVFNTGLFQSIFNNNLMVLVICFVTAFFIGDGAVFLITWNASVWGTIFGSRAVAAAVATGKNIYIYFILILIAVLPHMILEAISYFSAASAGGVVSKGILKEKFSSQRFREIIKATILFILIAIIILVIAAFVETYVLAYNQVYRTIIIQSMR